MCVHVNIFRSKEKAVGMLLTLNSQILIDYSLEHAWFEMYQLHDLVTWFAELSVCHDSSWKDMFHLIIHPVFKSPFLLLAKRIYVPYFFIVFKY